MPNIYVGKQLMDVIETRRAELQADADDYVSQQQALYSLLDEAILEDIRGIDRERWA
jgi:hypothetical protein